MDDRQELIRISLPPDEKFDFHVPNLFSNFFFDENIFSNLCGRNFNSEIPTFCGLMGKTRYFIGKNLQGSWAC